MKRWIFPAAVLLILLVIGLSIAHTYNAMIDKQEEVNKQWGVVQSVYQRRADLIPNLVSTVKGYAEHEKETLQAVMEARSQATSTTIQADQLDEQALQQFQQNQQALSSALSRLLVTVERYPDLKANQNFLDLQAQLEGTENRIAVERKKYNEAVQDYNSYIRNFPNNFYAGMFGFEKRPYYEAEPQSEKAPEVEF